jgi:hypothetical protein
MLVDNVWSFTHLDFRFPKMERVARDVGATRFLDKPFTIQQLRQFLRDSPPASLADTEGS